MVSGASCPRFPPRLKKYVLPNLGTSVLLCLALVLRTEPLVQSAGSKQGGEVLDDPLVLCISALMDAMEPRGGMQTHGGGSSRRADTLDLVWEKTPEGAVWHLLGRHCAVWG